MSRYRAGDPSLIATIRLKIAGNLWVLSAKVTARAEKNYQTAYFKRHGRPTIKEYLDGKL